MSEENRDKTLYPVFLDIEGRECLVVGGGQVAARKVSALLEAGADVTVVSPEAAGELMEHAAKGNVKWEKRGYEAGEAGKYFLVVSASDDAAVNELVSRDARAGGAIVNVVDAPALCDFYVPSVVRRGALAVAISTSGACPALARKLRERIEDQLPESYGRLAGKLGEFRGRVMERVADGGERKAIIERVARSPEAEKFLEGDEAPLEKLMSECI